jgi:hypothetical protein
VGRIINLETSTVMTVFLFVCSAMHPEVEDPIPLQVKSLPEGTEFSSARDRSQECNGL